MIFFIMIRRPPGSTPTDTHLPYTTLVRSPKQGTSIMQNLVILAGSVGASPESRTTTGGTKITNFSLATSRPKRDSNGKILKDDNNRRLEDTEWHRITCFNGVSKTVEQYVDKGMKVDRKSTRLNSSH